MFRKCSPGRSRFPRKNPVAHPDLRLRQKSRFLDFEKFGSSGYSACPRPSGPPRRDPGTGRCLWGRLFRPALSDLFAQWPGGLFCRFLSFSCPGLLRHLQRPPLHRLQGMSVFLSYFMHSAPFARPMSQNPPSSASPPETRLRTQRTRPDAPESAAARPSTALEPIMPHSPTKTTNGAPRTCSPSKPTRAEPAAGPARAATR